MPHGVGEWNDAQTLIIEAELLASLDLSPSGSILRKWWCGLSVCFKSLLNLPPELVAPNLAAKLLMFNCESGLLITIDVLLLAFLINVLVYSRSAIALPVFNSAN